MKATTISSSPNITVPRTQKYEFRVTAKSGAKLCFPCDKNGKVAELFGIAKIQYEDYSQNLSNYNEPVLVTRNVVSAVQKAYDQPFCT